MARRRAKDDDAETAKDPQATAGRRTRDTVSQVAFALRHRDEIVHSALEFLGAAGFLEPASRDRILATYEAGDTRTRLAIQELLGRVLKVPLDRLDSRLAEGQVDPARIAEGPLRELEDLILPEIDASAVADRIRAIELDTLLASGGDDNRFVRLFTDLPVRLNGLRLALLFGGLTILVVVVVALLFPQYALYIAFYGLLAALALLGGLMVTWAVRLERGARSLGVDLVVFSRLRPEERRLLLVRRLLVGVLDTRRLGDLVEKSLHSVLPERMQAPRRGDVVPAEARVPKRPVPRPPRGPAGPARPRKGDASSPTAADADERPPGARP